MAALYWKRLSYLVHRWLGTALGLLVLTWFVSGIVLMYYRWPELGESRQLATLRAFEAPRELIGFRAARAATDQASISGPPHGLDALDEIVGGRLMRWGHRLVYQLWHERDGQVEPAALVDALSGRVLSPVASGDAVRLARDMVPPLSQIRDVDLLAEGDHYTMAHALESNFPAYRIRFADPSRTAVYVSQEAGAVFGVVTNATRVTTWLGTVPHFMYFQWLYRRPSIWTFARLVPAAVAVVMAIAGIVFGTYSLYPWRRRGDWHVSAFRGVSKWHHISGVVFGLLVLTWTLSGILEELGGSNKARNGQAARSRDGAIAWSAIAVRESDATARVRSQIAAGAAPVAIDLAQLAGRPGYVFHLLNRDEVWVDAGTGAVRRDLPVADVREAAQRIVGGTAPVSAIDRIAKYDTYYYAHHGHEMHLPAWRVAFGDGAHSTVYLETVSGAPVGFVDDDSRTWRWIRDAAHTIDIAALNDQRPLRDLVLLPLLLGGTASAATGVWLLLRRVRRMVP